MNFASKLAWLCAVVLGVLVSLASYAVVSQIDEQVEREVGATQTEAAIALGIATALPGIVVFVVVLCCGAFISARRKKRASA